MRSVRRPVTLLLAVLVLAAAGCSGETKSRLSASLEAAPEALKPEIRTELAEVERMDQMSVDIGTLSAPLMSKMSRDSYHRMNRKRGRAVPAETDDDN